MKKFLRRFAFFLLQFFLIPVVVCAFFSYKAKEAAAAYELDASVNKLVMGDSRVQMTVDDTLISGMKNMSKGSEGFIFSYYKLQRLLENNHRIDTLFLGVSYHSFSEYFEEFMFHFDIASRYFFLLSPEAQFRVFFKVNNPFRLLLKSIATSYHDVYVDKKTASFLGNFETYATDVRLSKTSIENRIYYQFYLKGKLRAVSPVSVEYFNRIRKLCLDNSITLIVLNTPMHKDYEDGVPQKFKDNFNELVKGQGVSVIDFSDLALAEKDFLPDGDHLTVSGADKASKYLRDLLNHPRK